jgi:hypothetical protein
LIPSIAVKRAELHWPTLLSGRIHIAKRESQNLHSILSHPGLWGRIGVALGWLWGAYRLPINTLCGGFDVALMWLWALFLLSAFYFVL